MPAGPYIARTFNPLDRRKLPTDNRSGAPANKHILIALKTLLIFACSCKGIPCSSFSKMYVANFSRTVGVPNMIEALHFSAAVIISCAVGGEL